MLLSLPSLTGRDRIDRHALVVRHNVHVSALNSGSPLQVGNGEFAFNVDATGLQTFTPFNTLSHWGWHSSPLPAGTKQVDFQGQVWDTHGRPVRYPMPDPAHPAISTWMESNPHRINLGRIGLYLRKSDDSVVRPDDLRNLSQKLDLWSGIITSRFELEGRPVTVETACDPKSDTVAVKIDSKLISEGRIGAFFCSPGDDPRPFSDYIGDRTHPAALEIKNTPDGRGAILVRRLEQTETDMAVRWEGSASLSRAPAKIGALQILSAKYGAGDRWLDVTDVVRKQVVGDRLSVRAGVQLGGDPNPGVGKRLKVLYAYGGIAQAVEVQENDLLSLEPGSEKNRLTLMPEKGLQSFSFACWFSSSPQVPPNASEVFEVSRRHWPKFWQSGGAIDLSGSRDSRWFELERRIVLSQYLMAVNEAGSLPPQESGLVNNGWFGRFHMEMYWWHAAHWALWNRWPELENSLGIYRKLLAKAKQTASAEGYKGARWPKCIGPDGREWPHEIHALLIWQQPHPLFFAELDYRAHPTPETLREWWPVVEATADFMASYAYRDPSTGRYDLGPPVFVASENTDPKTTENPAFELGYWRFGLRVARNWRKRMGLSANADWDTVSENLAPLPTQDGLYVLYEGVQEMWTRFNFEHPALTGVFGMLPGDGADRETMRKTLSKIEAVWHFDRTWGWDCPLLAMCAARLGEPEKAVDYLLTTSGQFQFDNAGLATGGPFPYFPSNGGLLYAAAFMAAGWDGAQKGSAPGFPKNGTWKVRYEGLSKAP
ncbi:MAG TPA: hypothetical protein VG944_19225 [Fimbriimonas sp.]|nr:hypothetical protein [Fimbriimonas sp.]